MAQSVVCEIYLEECQDDELEEHRKMCTARLLFRCAICDGDYVSKEGLWNHLDLHEVADDSKEFHCQEMRATYKLHQCTLCNDHRGYQENLFWKHVHEEHDGFFLRCTECGESFRTQKLKTDHDLTNCKAREQKVNSGLEADQEFSNIVLPMQVENTTSLASCGAMNENAGIKLEPSQGELSNVLGEDSECSGMNLVDQQIMKHKESRYKCSHCPKLFLRKKDQYIHSSKCKNNQFSCEICHQKFKFEIGAVRHKNRVHRDEGVSKKVQIDRISCNEQKEESQAEKTTVKQEITVEDTTSNPEEILHSFVQNLSRSKNQQEQIQSEQMTLKMEITTEETTFLQHDYFGISMPNTSTITDCPDFIQHSNVLNVDNSQPLPVDCGGQKSALTQERQTDIPKELAHTDLENDIVDNWLNEHSSAESNGADGTDDNTTLKKYEVPTIASLKSRNEAKMADEKNLQSPVEDPLNRTSEAKCFQCDKRFSNVAYLACHMESNHQSYPCQICGITLSNYHQARYHKMTAHTEPKHKCPHCLKLFYRKEQQRAHFSKCKAKKFSCEICHQKFRFEKGVLWHKQRFHHDEEASKKAQIDRIPCNEQKEQKQAEKITVQKEISVEESTSIPEKILEPLEQNSSSESSNIKCSLCGKKSLNVISLARHIETCHKPSACNICGIKFPNLVKVRYHKITRHREPKHKCSHCFKLFHRKKDHRIHLSRCKSKRFSCEICHKKFKVPKGVVWHMIRFHNDEGASKKAQINSKRCSKKIKQPQAVNKEITVEKTTSIVEKMLQPHVQDPSSLLTNTKCSHCGKIFLDILSLSYHNDRCHKPTTCNICGKSFPGMESAKYHKRKYHTEAKYNCPDCPKQFHHKGNFQAHRSVCLSRKFSCELCGKKFKNLSFLNDHKRRVHHKKRDLSNIKASVKNCKNQQEQKQAEEITLKMEIKVEETTLSQHDDFETSTQNQPSPITDCLDLSQHAEVPEAVNSESAAKVTVKKEIFVEETTSNLFIIIDCPICGENFGDQNQVSHHVEAIHQMIMCANCGMIFTSADQLNDHKLTCPQHLEHVDSQYRSNEISQLHAETSSRGLSDTVCPHCDKDCCHEALLARHITWFHQPFMCATCGITTSGKHRTKYHKKKYHSEPKFHCRHCSKKFHWKNNYLRHVSKHAKDRKFPCKHCGRKYKNAYAVKDHMRRTGCNELKPWPCENVNSTQGENMELTMEIKVEETTLQEEDYQTLDEDCEKPPTATIISAGQLRTRKIKYHMKSKFSCSKCHQTFHEIKAFQAHVKHVHREKQIFQCKMCDHQLENRRKLQTHIAREHKSVEMQCNCPICGVAVSSADKLRYHKLKHHAQKKFKCPHCPRKFISEKVALAHMRIHKNTKSKRLILLQARVQQRHSDITKKEVDHENEVNIKEEPLEDNTLIAPQSSTGTLQCHEADDQMEACPICGDIFENKRKMKYHKRVTHTERKYKCSLCPLTFHFGGKLRRHEKVHTKMETCKLCSKKFPDELCLERHLTSVHSYAEQQCYKCNLKFTSLHELNYHMERLHTEPRFKCPDCGKMYRVQHALRKHMDVHSNTTRKKMNENEDAVDGDLAQNQSSSLQNIESEHLEHGKEIDIQDKDQPKTCPICELVFENTRRLRYHELVNHTEPKHKCSYCPKMFHFMPSLRQHEAIHIKNLEAEGYMVCNLCPMRFPDKCSLQSHISCIHPPSKMSCSKCDLKFTTRHKLYHHERKIHTEGSFKCPDCGKFYKDQYALRRHMAVHLKTKQNSKKGRTKTAEKQIEDNLDQKQNSSLQNVE